MSKDAKTKAVCIPEHLHSFLKVCAARQGRKLNDVVTEKLSELMPVGLRVVDATKISNLDHEN